MSGVVEGPPQMIDGLAVRCFGDADAPALLLSAGLGGSGAYWMPQVGALASDYHVILYDHRGTGNSDRGALPADYAAENMARDMLGILDGLGVARAHVVGHAAGGIAGLELARLRPERLASLTVVNGWAVADPYLARCFEIRLALHDAGGVEAYLKAQPLFLYPASWISANLADLDAEQLIHSASFQNRVTLEARIGALIDFDARSWLAGVHTPTLVIVCGDDMLVPPMSGRLLAQGLPRATLCPLTWGGHSVNVTDPAHFNALLHTFLREHPLT